MNVFNMDIEEFDARFRVWLRKKYEGVADRGTPREFGRPFYIHGVSVRANQASPAISPSHDLVAAFTTYKQDVDVALFGIPDRKLYKNLTKGYTVKYEYLIAQGFTTAPKEGRDLAFSPDGDRIAVFARAEGTRSLLLLDTKKGGIAEREGGAVMLTGGNIEGRTRVLTTAIVLSTRQGDFAVAMALGIVLLGLTLAANAVLLQLQGRTK